MMANCTRWFGLQSTLAPTSTKMVGRPLAVGRMAARRRPIDCRQRSHHKLGHGHASPGISSADDTGGTSVTNQLGGNAHRRVFLFADRRRNGFVHGDDFARMHDFDGQILSPVLPKLFFNTFLDPDQNDANLVLLRSLDRSLHFCMRSAVSSHGIDGNLNHKRECATASPKMRTSREATSEDHVTRLNKNESGAPQESNRTYSSRTSKHLAAIIVAAMRTSAMRHFQFVAVGTLRSRTDLKKVVSAPFVAPGL